MPEKISIQPKNHKRYSIFFPKNQLRNHTYILFYKILPYIFNHFWKKSQLAIFPQQSYTSYKGKNIGQYYRGVQMEFLKINEKAIRCILNFEELKEQNIRLEDMMMGTPPAKEFLNEIIIQACLELNMNLGGQKLSVHVMPLPGDRIDLLISELNESGSEADNIPSGDKETAAYPAPPAVIPELMNQKQLSAIYRFSSLEPVEQLARRIVKSYGKESCLLKDAGTGIYYLCINEKRKKFRNLTDIAGDYGTLYSLDPIMLSSLKEHCEIIIKKQAIKWLSKL
jgi:negative regulator of genetic competence, sporulation and motility